VKTVVRYLRVTPSTVARTRSAATRPPRPPQPRRARGLRPERAPADLPSAGRRTPAATPRRSDADVRLSASRCVRRRRRRPRGRRGACGRARAASLPPRPSRRAPGSTSREAWSSSTAAIGVARVHAALRLRGAGGGVEAHAALRPSGRRPDRRGRGSPAPGLPRRTRQKLRASAARFGAPARCAPPAPGSDGGRGSVVPPRVEGGWTPGSGSPRSVARLYATARASLRSPALASRCSTTTKSAGTSTPRSPRCAEVARGGPQYVAVVFSRCSRRPARPAGGAGPRGLTTGGSSSSCAPLVGARRVAFRRHGPGRRAGSRRPHRPRRGSAVPGELSPPG
jgi:hypothetical protein